MKKKTILGKEGFLNINYHNPIIFKVQFRYSCIYFLFTGAYKTM